MGEVEFQLLPHPHSLDFDWILVLLTTPALGTFLVLCKPHPRHTHTLFSPILFLRRVDLHLFIFSFSKSLLFFSLQLSLFLFRRKIPILEILQDI